ncbi:MAG: Trk system potassium transporter TrkA [Dysgonamonadaceae bacterium]|jgi:trk system potassium uptake protein TrkA|nr:Trk system potassium transporter TrkA [Dysgonamonadaceae bacterium]
MKIIIAGAGEVGTHLAKLLSQENQDIVLMDADEERLAFTNYNMEIMSVEGSPTSIKDLLNAGVKNVDLFVGVTPEETTNITACMLAAKLGARKTLARINNYEYLLPNNLEFFRKLGIDSLIYPEMLAAREIVSAIERPWARQWWELCNGELILIGVKVRSNAPIVGKFLYEISREEKIYHIVAIKRGNETIIPRGNDQVMADDLLYFTTTKDRIDTIREHTGKNHIQVSKIIIMGGGRIAVKAAQYLSDHHVQIKILEMNKEKSYKIAEQVESNILIINGDGRDTELLLNENIKGCDAFMALTGNSETNILACVAAKRFNIPKTIAQVENIDYITMAEKMDIGTVINKKLIAASHIYRFLLNADVANIKCLTFANADVAELVAKPGSRITRRQVKDLNLPKDMTLGGLIRDGKPIIIEGYTQVQADDHVVIFCLNTAMHKLQHYFN